MGPPRVLSYNKANKHFITSWYKLASTLVTHVIATYVVVQVYVDSTYKHP